MKKLFLITLFLIPFLTFSQTRKPITGFFGIPFGSNPEMVKTKLANKGARFLADSSEANFLIFTNISWQSRKNLYLFVKFVNNKAYEADLLFYNTVNTKAIENYNNVVEEANEVYGPGLVKKNFTPPYREYDGKELEAIAEGKAEYITAWADLQNNNGIMARIFPAYYTGLIFQNDDLRDEAAKQAGEN